MIKGALNYVGVVVDDDDDSAGDGWGCSWLLRFGVSLMPWHFVVWALSSSLQAVGWWGTVCSELFGHEIRCGLGVRV